MKLTYDIKKTLFFKNNVGKLDGVEFKPIKYTYQGVSYGYGLDIVCDSRVIIKIKPKQNGYFFVSYDEHYLECKHIKSIKDVARYVANKVWIYWIY